jgi:PAS domain S-box-containing protein
MLLCAAVSVALASICLAGWHIQNQRMIAWLPGKNAMVYNTAISLMLLGQGMLAAALSRRRIAGLLAILGGLPSLLTLYEYVAGVTLGIDELLMRSGEAVEYPGRIAPNTAVCLLSLSLALLGMPARNGFRSRIAAAPVLASAALGFSAVSLGGHLTGFATFEWSGFIPMAVPTSCGLMSLSLGILFFCWRNTDVPGPGPPVWLFLTVSIASMAMAISLWQAVAAEERDRAAQIVASHLEAVRFKVLGELSLRVAAVKHLAHHWKSDGPMRTLEAEIIMNALSGFRTIRWVDPPLKGAGFTSASNRISHVTAPVRLLTGKEGINIRVPTDNGYGGFIVAELRFEDLFPQILPTTLAPGYAISIESGGQRLYSRDSGSEQRDKQWGRETILEIEDARWTVRVWPTPSALAFMTTTSSKIALGAGLLLSALLGWALHSAQAARLKTRAAEHARRDLQDEVAERLRAQHELNQFFTLAPAMLCIAGFDGYFKRLNAAWESTLGVPLERLLAEPYRNFVHPDDLTDTRQAARDQKSGISVSSFENRYRAQDGSYRWLRWNSLPSPERELIFAAARDVTAEKAAEEASSRAAAELERRVRERTSELEHANRALRESEELFRRLFEESPIGTALVDLEHRFLHVNKALCGLLGYEASELSGLSLEKIIYRDELHPVGRLFGQMIAGQTSGYRLSKQYLRKDGEIVWGDVTATILCDERGRPTMVLGMIENITERRRRDEQIAQLNSELRARVGELTGLNAELESFNYSISHDLRAPLRHIDGFSKILLAQHGAQVPDSAKAYMERICEGARRMSRMVDELLDLSRTSRREMARRPTELNPLLGEVLRELEPDLHGRQIEWRIGDMPAVDCDPAHARQVFANLLSNAVKFTRSRSPACIEVGQTCRDGQMVLFVRDNGVGFSMKNADKLFGVFQRLHRAEDFEGTGVGLATVQRIVHKHGGRIWAEAAPDQGATFYFTMDDGQIKTSPGIE